MWFAFPNVDEGVVYLHFYWRLSPRQRETTAQRGTFQTRAAIGDLAARADSLTELTENTYQMIVGWLPEHLPASMFLRSLLGTSPLESVIEKQRDLKPDVQRLLTSMQVSIDS